MRCDRNRCSAPLHMAITTVLTVPPTRWPSAFISSKGSVRVLYERWLVIESLKIVLGARPRFNARSPLPVFC
ncbi:hypothetical protein D3C87_1681150 [compost metagenome]